MIALLGAFLGFLSSLVPELMQMANSKDQRANELALRKAELDAQRDGVVLQSRAQELTAQSEQDKVLYATYYSNSPWVDAFNGTVRPILTYGFFSLYCFAKYHQIDAAIAMHSTLPWHDVASMIWGEEDSGLLASVVSFYFGRRAMTTLRPITKA